MLEKEKELKGEQSIYRKKKETKEDDKGGET